MHENALPGAGASYCTAAPLAVGKALAFTSAMTVLVKKFPSQDNGVAFVFQGSYFLAAPWPLRSPRKALACYEKAVQVGEIGHVGEREDICLDTCSFVHQRPSSLLLVLFSLPLLGVGMLPILVESVRVYIAEDWLPAWPKTKG